MWIWHAWDRPSTILCICSICTLTPNACGIWVGSRIACISKNGTGNNASANQGVTAVTTTTNSTAKSDIIHNSAVSGSSAADLKIVLSIRDQLWLEVPRHDVSNGSCKVALSFVCYVHKANTYWLWERAHRAVKWQYRSWCLKLLSRCFRPEWDVLPLSHTTQDDCYSHLGCGVTKATTHPTLKQYVPHLESCFECVQWLSRLL